MSDAAKAEGAVEADAATKAAAAHKNDTLAIKDERHALETLATAAKLAQQWTAWGGRTDPGAYMADQAKTLEYKRLINIQNWLGFTNPQSAYAWREKERLQAVEMNKAIWGGYTSPDQYLGYLAKQRTELASLNTVLQNRAQIYRDSASSALSYADALAGTHQSVGQLGSNMDLTGLNQFQAALAGLPDTVTTRLTVDDAGALGELAKYEALLRGVPHAVSTSEVLTAATALGGVSLDKQPQVIPVSYGGQYQEQFATIMAEVARLDRLRAEIPVHFDLPDAAAVAAFVSSLPAVTESVHLVSTGGAVGVGPGPPPRVVDAWTNLSNAEAKSLIEAKLAGSAETAAGDAAAAAVPKVGSLAAAWEKLSAAEKDAFASDPGGGAPLLPAGAGGGGKPPIPPPAAAAAGAEEPPSDAAAKWAALSDAEKAAATDADLAAVKFAALRAAASGDADTASKLASVYRTLSGDTKDAGDAATVAAAGFGVFSRSLAGFAGFGTTLALFGGLAGTVGVVHLLIDAIIELIAITVLAVVGLAAVAAALALFAAAGQQAAQQVVQRLQAVQVAATATGQAIYPLTGAFAQLQDTARPAVWQLYGDALNLVGNHANALNTVVQKTGAYLDQLAAKAIVFVSSPGFQQGLKTLVTAGVGVLKQLGDILRNLGAALVEFARVAQTTHVAEDLLAIINAGAKLLDLILKLPTPILAAAVGLHAFYLWGGLLATGLLTLLDPLRSVALGIGGVSTAESALAATAADAGGWAKLKSVLSDIGAGFAALPGRIAGAGAATKAVGADMALAGDEAALMSGEEEVATVATFSLAGAFRALGASMLTLLANPLTWLAAAAVVVGVVAYKIFTANDNTQKWITGMDAALAKSSTYQVIGKTVADLAAVTQQLAAAQKTGTGNASELAAAQTDLSGKLQAELTHVGQVSKAYGVDMPTALDLLNVAGVKTDTLFTQNNKTWAAALVQVAGLVQGYRAMGQGLTQLQGDVSVQLVMNADQLAQMGKLNTAWDSWLKLVESGPAAFVAFEQGVQTVSTDMKVAGASFAGTNAASLTLRASWDSLVPTAGNVLDAVRNYSAVLQNGADGSALLVRATKDVIASSGQLATKNQDVRNSLIAVAEQADPSINTWQKLTQWIGPLGAAKATSDLDKVMTLLQTPVTNLQKDAALLTTTLQQDLNPAMATAEFNALGGQKAFNTFATDLTKFGPDAKPTIDAAHAVAVELVSIDKNTKTAHDQFVAWATSMGMSKDAANKMWAEVSKGITPINAVRDGLAQSAIKADNLAKSGLWAQMKDLTTQGFSQIGTFFSKTIPADADAMAKSVSTAWGTAYNGFQRDLAGPMTAWFTQSLPHAFGTVPGDLSLAWGTSYNGFQRDLAGPLTAWFTKTVPADAHAMSSSVSTAWGTAYNGFQRDLAGPITHWATVLLPKSMAGQAFSTAWGTAWNGFNRDIVSNVGGFFTKTLPGYLDGAGRSWNSTWSGAWTKFVANIWNPFSGFFTKTLPGYLDSCGRVWNSTWSTAWNGFVRDIWNPFSGFFTKTIPSWFGGTGASWGSLWSTAWNGFVRDIWNPFSGFFTKTVPSWFGGTGTSWGSLWSTAWNGFVRDIWNPFSGFFTKTLPGYLDSCGRAWNSTWSSGWANFVRDIINPMSHWFTNTLPGVISSAIKAGINDAIGHINSAIDLVNAVTHIVGIPKIGHVGYVAASGGVMPSGGSIAGTGDEDGTHIIAMGGEYMVRKPARMALEATYGRNFMNTLNQADTWLGAGSRGNFASQRPPHMAAGGYMASGGNADPVGGWARPERIDQGVDYGGAGPLYAISHGTITNLYNSGWPGGAFVGLRMDQGAQAGKYWYYAEDIAPLTNVGATVSAGQHIANATGGGSGIEIGFAAPPGSGQSMASATGETKGSAVSTGWGVAASNFIKSLGGPGGILQSGGVQGGTPGISGGFSAIWQNLLGLLDSAGTGLSGALSALSGDVTGGAAELLKLAQQGGKAVFDGVWSGAIQPLINKALPNPESIPSSVLQYVAASVKNGVDSLMSAKDAAAQSSAAASNSAISAGAPGPGGGNAAANAALARKLMPAWSGGTEWLAWNALEMAEAGWNQYARNQSSGAYGIPQALPPSKMGAAANPPQSNPTAQINWMISYIKSIYGDPIGANRHENMFHWYPSGGAVGYAQGDVIAAIEAATTNQEIREAMALGSYLESGWNDTAAGDAGTSFGPFQIHLPAHPGVTKAEAENAAWATKFMLPSYATGVNQTVSSLWKTNPVGAAENAAYLAERPAKTYYASQGSTAVNAAWAAATKALGTGSPAPVTAATVAAPAAAAASASSMTPVQAWAYYANKLPTDVQTESDAFWAMNGAQLPSNAGVQAWEDDYAWLLLLQAQQMKLGTYWNQINADLGTPGNLGAFAGAQDWSALGSEIGLMESWTAGNVIPPKSYWVNENVGPWPKGYPVGQIPPSGWATWKYQNAAWTKAKNAMQTVQADVKGAGGAWNDLWGPSGSISTSAPTPGPTVVPAGGGSIVVDLQSLIAGGPQSPVLAKAAGISLSGTGSGFAGGGEVSLSDVAGMFALGGTIPVLPAMSNVPQGLVPSLASQSNGQGTPRTVTSSAGDSIGVQVGNLTIMNPVAEKPSDSITRSSNRLAFLAGRGPV